MATAKKATAKTEEVKVSNVQGKFEVFPVGDVFMYRLKASNGEILVTSELYSSLKGAKSAIDTVIKSINDGNISVTKDKHNYYQFKLFSSNKRLLVASANYASQDRCESAAQSFKKFAINAKIVELEKDEEQLMEEITIENKENKKGGKLIISVTDGEFDFKLTASNGAIIASSEIYKSKAGAVSGIDTFKQAIANGKFFVVKDKRAMYQFKLYSSAGRVVVYGEVYKAKAQAISAANSVASFIESAELVDSTK